MELIDTLIAPKTTLICPHLFFGPISLSGSYPRIALKKYTLFIGKTLSDDARIKDHSHEFARPALTVLLLPQLARRMIRPYEIHHELDGRIRLQGRVRTLVVNNDASDH